MHVWKGRFLIKIIFLRCVAVRFNVALIKVQTESLIWLSLVKPQMRWWCVALQDLLVGKGKGRES